MSNFFAPLYRAIDNSGNVMSGALLYFYDTGTTTPRSTYPTYALALAGGGSANANPVVADSNGWFGRIYLQPDYLYTVVLKTSGGTTIWTQDDVDGAFLNDSSIATRLEQIASNPMDNGATGDGVADDSTEVQAAITAATGVVDLLGKTYRCDAALSLKSGLTIKNGSLDFSNCADNAYLVATGTVGAANLLTGNVSAGAVVLPLTSVTGLASGDLLWLTDSGAYGAATGTDGEICRIVSIAALNVTIAAPLNGSYTTANTASVKEITAKSDIVLEDLTVTASKLASGTGILVSATYCDRFRIHGCKFTGIKAAGARFTTCALVNISGSRFEDGAAAAIGIDLLDGCIDIGIDSSSIASMAKGVALGLDGAGRKGVARNLGISSCTFENCSTAGIHAGILSRHIQVLGSKIRALNPADCIHLTSCIDVRVYGCALVGGDYGIDDTTVTSLVATSNYITGQTTGQIRGSASAVGVFTGTSGQIGVLAQGGAGANGITTTGGTDGYGIQATGGSSGDFSGGYFQGGADNGIGVEGMGDGSGVGVYGAGGHTNAAGLSGLGGGTTGAGIIATGASGGPGGTFTGGTYGVNATGGTVGVRGIASSAGNGEGGVFAGYGGGNGVEATGGSSGGHGVVAVGGGAGYGIHATGGNSVDGHGVYCTGGSGGGRGVYGVGTGIYAGVRGDGGPTNGTGIIGNGGTTHAKGGDFTGTGTAAGATATGGSTSGPGFYGTGGGSGAGIIGVGGATGYGGSFTGNATKSAIHLAPVAAAPSSPEVGDIYVDSNVNHIYCYINGGWRQLD